MTGVDGRAGAVESVRLDRWLFAVRIFKSRSLAAKAIAGGRIKVDGSTVKAHRLIRIGEEIEYKREGRTYRYKVLGLLEKRVGAKDAQQQYELTEDADLMPEMREMLKIYRESEVRAPRNKGRPTKRDRRLLERFRDDE